MIVVEYSGDISEIHRLDLLARLEADVTSAIRAFEARVKSLRMAGDTTITRRQLAEACRLFNMPVPALGKAVDLQRAKLRRNQYVRHIHSDSGGSGDGAQMKVVVETYELLERYNAQKGIRHDKNAR
jgi:hypothetical protein